MKFLPRRVIERCSCSRKHRKSDGTNARTGWRFGETQHGMWGRYQLRRIKDQGERTNTEEDATGSGDDQTEGDGEEHLQPNGTMAIDDILVSKQLRNEHGH